jgi:hypothetical protein
MAHRKVLVLGVGSQADESVGTIQHDSPLVDENEGFTVVTIQRDSKGWSANWFKEIEDARGLAKGRDLAGLWSVILPGSANDADGIAEQVVRIVQEKVAAATASK